MKMTLTTHKNTMHLIAAIVSVVILIGTVVNNPILLVDQTIHNIRDDRMAPEDAVKQALDPHNLMNPGKVLPG